MVLVMMLQKFTRPAVWLSVLAIALLSAGCRQAGPASPAGASALERMKREQVLHAGYINYPPFVIRDPNSGELSGYFIELFDEIAAQAGARIEYTETDWGTMVAGLQTGKFDVVISGVFRTIPRAKEVTFAEPLLYVGLSAIARAGDERFQSAADLRQPGLTVAVTSGEVGHEYAKRFLPEAKLVVISTDDISRPMLEVLAGRADVALGDSMTCSRFTAAHPEAQNLFARQPLYVYGTTVMVRRGDPDWLDFLNLSLEFMELSGATARLEAKYKGDAEAWLSKPTPYLVPTDSP